LPTARASHIKYTTKFRNAKLEMASVKIAELQRANRNFEATIAELQEKSDRFKDAANTEISILKSNAWLDQIALRQKDKEIEALERCLDMRGDINCQDQAQTLNETQKLNLAIVDLSRVKKELMEEIHELEAKKEELEFA
jgi:chromosome segregation ATPase